MKFDVHTHHVPISQEHIAFISQSYKKGEVDCPHFTAGLHPWFLQEFPLNEAKLWLHNKLNHPGCVAVGEAGLDKICSTNWQLQQEALNYCIQQSESFKLPLILHCVRAHDELLSFKKHTAMPWIFHGFNKKPEITQKLLNSGAILSFGAAIMKESTPAAIALKQCPNHRFLLETDDNTTYSISDIYEQAARLRGIATETLETMIEETAKIIFKIP